MAVENESRREHNPVRTTDSEAAERAASLAPPEEEGGASGAKRDAVLSVDTGGLKLPEAWRIDEDERDARGLFHLEPVLILILVLVLAYICVIAYLIWADPDAAFKK
ncbi:MAG TPA: hypothetical protein VF553_09960 [Pyrinomonadaceae bacterium]|jgi:hypothetical protein